MFDLKKFNIITLSDSEELYDYQCYLLNQISEETLTDIVLQVAILQTFPPVEDYNEVIKILRAYFEQNKDIRICILGAYLSSTWENYKVNDFLGEISDLFQNADDQQKSILYYLMAYDIYKRNEITNQKDRYVELLNKSVTLSKRFYYNYCLLAKISDRKRAKELMRIGLSQVEKINSESDSKKMTISYFVKYESFVNEYILGIVIPEGVFFESKKFYKR